MSSLNINKRGNNMKKTLIVLITAVLAISMLFVSCSNEANLDERVSVQFITPHSRSLSASVSADPETLVWHYSATKKSLTEFNYGATQDSIVGKDNAGNFYSIELSQGLWDFELWAVADSVEYYRGNTKGVLIEKKSDNTPVPISIVVSPFGGTGKLEIKDVVIAKKTTNGFANTTYVPNTVSIKKDGNVISQNPSLINGACEIDNLNTGSYDITLSYVEGNINVASAKITVVVYSGRTTTVSGTIEETTSSGQFKVNVQKNGNSTTVTTDAISDVSSAIPITDRTDTSPATVSVIVPENTVTSGSTLIVEKKITEQPSTVNVTAGNGATFYDVKLQQLKDGVTTDFVLSGDNYFTVELFVGKNLDIVNFKHHDTPLSKVDTIGGNNQYMYDSRTGYITFTTSSFSPFTAEYKFGGGLGTAEAPYLISNNDNYKAIGNINWDRYYYFKQECDLVVKQPVSYFWGEYDGNNHSIKFDDDMSVGLGNWTALFWRLKGNSTFKNMNVLMDSFAVSLVCDSWPDNIGYSINAYNINFSRENNNSNPININATNFGFITINAIITNNVDAQAELECTFRNIINNVSIQNASTCTGVLIGGGIAADKKIVLNIDSCVNTGTISGKDQCGFIYGNTSYDIATNNKITFNISNCENKGTIKASKISGFMPKNAKDNYYMTIFGGNYQLSTNVFDNVAVSVTQTSSERPVFMVESALGEEFTTKIAVITTAKYWTLDNQKWEDEDVSYITNDTWSDRWNVSNGFVSFIDKTEGNTEETSACQVFKAYDPRTAKSNGVINDDTLITGGWIIVNKDNTNYIVFNVGEDTYINSNASVFVYAYNSEGVLAGTKQVK